MGSTHRPLPDFRTWRHRRFRLRQRGMLARPRGGAFRRQRRNLTPPRGARPDPLCGKRSHHSYAYRNCRRCREFSQIRSSLPPHRRPRTLRRIPLKGSPSTRSHCPHFRRCQKHHRTRFRAPNLANPRPRSPQTSRATPRRSRQRR